MRKMQGAVYVLEGDKVIVRSTEPRQFRTKTGMVPGTVTAFALLPYDKVEPDVGGLVRFDPADVICVGRTIDDVEYQFEQLLAVIHGS